MGKGGESLQIQYKSSINPARTSESFLFSPSSNTNMPNPQSVNHDDGVRLQALALAEAGIGIKTITAMVWELAGSQHD